MPEAAVDEDGAFFADEGDVGTDGSETRDGRQETRGRRKTDAAVKAVAGEAGVPEGFAGRDLGARILCPIRTHHPRNGFALRHRRSFVADVHKEILATNGHESHECVGICYVADATDG